MEATDYLLTCAEIAAALAGFAALIVALSDRQRDRLLPSLVATLIERSLVALMLSLLPALLLGLGVGSRLLWAVCSGLLAAYVLSLAIRSAALRRAEPDLWASMLAGPVFVALYACGIGVLALQAFNATGLFVTPDVWWYLVGLSWLLASVCYHFFIFVRSWSRNG
jgi:hypothetical protein